MSQKFSTLLFVEAPEAKYLQKSHIRISRGIPYLYGNSCFAISFPRSSKLPRIPRYVSLFFASCVQPILAALFSRDSHATVSRDSEGFSWEVESVADHNHETPSMLGGIFLAFSNKLFRYEFLHNRNFQRQITSDSQSLTIKLNH